MAQALLPDRADDETRNLIIELIEANLTPDEIKDTLREGAKRDIVLTSTLHICLKGVQYGAMTATLYERGQPAKQAYLSMWNFKI